jgi:hypothetical protein
VYPEEWKGTLAFGVDPEVLDAFGYVPMRIRKYADTWKLSTDAGELALRAAHVPQVTMEGVFLVSECLAQCGCASGSPRLIRSRYNDAYVRDGDVYYYLTSWPDGVLVDMTQTSHLEGAVTALANWHQAAHGALPSANEVDETEALRWYRQAKEKVRVRLHSLFDKQSLTAFEKDVREQLAIIVEELDTVDATLAAVDWWDSDRQAASDGWLCHGRLMPENLRYTGDGYTILHYEHVYCGHPYLDMARFLSVAMPLHHWDGPLLQRLVACYQKGFEPTASQTGQLAALLRLPYELLDAAADGFERNDDAIAADIADALERFALDTEARSRAITLLLADEATDPTPEPTDETAHDVVHAEMSGSGRGRQVDVRAASVRGTSKQPIRIHRYRPKNTVSTSQLGGPQGIHLFPNSDDDS